MTSRSIVLALALVLLCGCSIRRAPDAAGGVTNDLTDDASIPSRPDGVGTGVPMGYVNADGSSPFDMTDLHRGVVAPPETASAAEPTRSKADDAASAAPPKTVADEDDDKTKNKNRRAETPLNAGDEKKRRRGDPDASPSEDTDAKRRR